MLRKIIKDHRGFTIIEVIVATFVFSIMVLSVAAIFSKAIQLERSARSAQKVEENALFTLEFMAKEIRVSKITSPDSPSGGAATLSITHPVNGGVTYALNQGNLERTVAGQPSVMSSSDVTFSSLKFYITGTGINDNQSPKITILASIKNTAGAGVFKVDLQTTVVSRDILSEIQN